MDFCGPHKHPHVPHVIRPTFLTVLSLHSYNELHMSNGTPVLPSPLLLYSQSQVIVSHLSNQAKTLKIHHWLLFYPFPHRPVESPHKRLPQICFLLYHYCHFPHRSTSFSWNTKTALLMDFRIQYIHAKYHTTN